MGEQRGKRVVPEIFHDPFAAPLQPPTPQAQALIDQAQALADQAQAFAAQAQVPANEAQVPAAQAQALAAQAQALANQAQALVAYENDVDQVEKGIFAYKEITNLHDINLHYPIHKLALEDWERREEYLRNSISRKEGQSNDLTNQIYGIFTVFVVFLGLVLIAVSHLTQTTNTELGAVPVCGKIWFPIVLTGFATVVTIVGILHKFWSLQSLESTILKERQAKIEIAKRANSLRREGPQKFKFNIHTNNSIPVTKPKSFLKNFLLLIVSLVIFTFIFILSYFVILCDTWAVRKWDGGLHR